MPSNTIPRGAGATGPSQSRERRRTSSSARRKPAAPKSKLNGAHVGGVGTIEFLKTLFGARTKGDVFICSLANSKGEADKYPPRSIVTRDPDVVDAFIAKYDTPGRSCYLCVNTVKGSKRNAETVDEIHALHADLDFKDIVERPEIVLDVLESMKNRPSIVVRSGHGYHAYWLLQDALPNTVENRARVETTLLRLVDALAADPVTARVGVCALLQMPNTVNTKNPAEPVSVEVVWAEDRHFSLEVLERWLSIGTTKFLTLKTPPEPKAAPGAPGAAGEAPDDRNIWQRYGDEIAQGDRLDVEAELERMAYHGGDRNSINWVQLRVSASMLARGMDENEVIATILAHTKRVHARDCPREKWDWAAEERSIRSMCRRWRKKRDAEEREDAVGPDAKAGSAGGQSEPGAAEPNAKAGAPGEHGEPGAVEPVDLWGHFSPPPPPRGLLPPLIERYALVESETMGADAGAIAMAALTVCAAAITDEIQLKMKKHNEVWRESARIWTGIVGDPGVMKSPIMRAAVRPLAKIDAKLFADYATAMARYNELKKEEKEKAVRPTQRRKILEDTTIEAAEEVLADNSAGLLLHQDELAGWFGSMDKYSGAGKGAQKDRTFWLKSFNGDRSGSNRIGRGSKIIPNLSFTVLGGIQPDIIRKLAADGHDDGFLARMFLIVAGPAALGKDEPTPSVVEEYAVLVDRLVALSPLNFDHNPFALYGTKAGEAPPLVFDERAQRLRSELELRHLRLSQAAALNRKLCSHLDKWNGLFGRLCVLFHVIEHAHDQKLPSVVAEKTAGRVARFMHEYLLGHALAFYSGILELADDHERLSGVASFILSHRLEQVTTRDLQRGIRTMRKLTKWDTDKLLEQLEALGWLTRVPSMRAGVVHWRVNPVVHQRFAERAKQEAQRRATVREVILDLAAVRRSNLRQD